MEILQAEQDLTCDRLDKTPWDTLSSVLLDEREEILAKRFEDDADVSVERRGVSERVEEGDDVGAAGV